MPEGPEIRRAADALREVLEGEVVQAAEMTFFVERGRTAPDVTGLEIERVETRGKAMLVHFGGGPTLYSHNQLYGRWYTRKDHGHPSTGRNLRLALRTDRGSALLYSATDIEWLDESGIANHAYLSKLGPDLLRETTTARTVIDRLAERRFRRRRMLDLYLDQAFLAGIGNYLRSEILFHARVDPWSKPHELERAALTRLGRSTLTIGWRALELKGATNTPSRIKAMRARGLSRRQWRHLVFERDGQSCYRCEETVLCQEVSGRRVFYCPGCQLPPAISS